MKHRNRTRLVKQIVFLLIILSCLITGGYIIFNNQEDDQIEQTPLKKINDNKQKIRNTASEIKFESYTASGKKINITSPQGYTDNKGLVTASNHITTIQSDGRVIKLTGGIAHFNKDEKKLELNNNIKLSDDKNLDVSCPSGVLDMESEEIKGDEGIQVRENGCTLTGQNYVITKEQKTIHVHGKARLIIKEK